MIKPETAITALRTTVERIAAARCRAGVLTATGPRYAADADGEKTETGYGLTPACRQAARPVAAGPQLAVQAAGRQQPGDAWPEVDQDQRAVAGMVDLDQNAPSGDAEERHRRQIQAPRSADPCAAVRPTPQTAGGRCTDPPHRPFRAWRTTSRSRVPPARTALRCRPDAARSRSATPLLARPCSSR